jgi:DNA-binding transcriptional MerR regulator
MKFLDIAEVSGTSGLPASTLRYYEEVGLIESVGRRGLRRQYDPSVLKWLALINMARAAGFSLDEIGPMFGGRGTGSVIIPRDELHLRAAELESNADQIRALATMMRHVADCPAPSHLQCPTFQKLMRIGTKYQSRTRRKQMTHSVARKRV